MRFSNKKRRRKKNEIGSFLKDRIESTDVIVISRLLFDAIEGLAPGKKFLILERVHRESEILIKDYRKNGRNRLKGSIVRLKIKGFPDIVVLNLLLSSIAGISHPTIFVNVESTNSIVMSMNDLKTSIVDDAISMMLDETKQRRKL